MPLKGHKQLRYKAKASDDRTIPSKYEGAVEPNYYCRGYNAKQKKYCKKRAGAGTAHPGIGRCKQHGGTRQGNPAAMSHGKFSSLTDKQLVAVIERYENDPALLDLRAPLAMLYAFVERTVNQYEELRSAVMLWQAAVRGTRSKNPEFGELCERLLANAPNPKQQYLLDFTHLKDLLGEIRQYATQMENVAGRISLQDVQRSYQQMARAVEIYNDEPDPTLRMRKIRDAWNAISIRMG